MLCDFLRSVRERGNLQGAKFDYSPEYGEARICFEVWEALNEGVGGTFSWALIGDQAFWIKIIA